MIASLKPTPTTRVLSYKVERKDCGLGAVETTGATHDNQAELERLEWLHKALDAAYAAAGSSVTASIFIPEPVSRAGCALGGMAVGRLVLNQKDKTETLLRNSAAVIEAFAEQQAQIFVNRSVPGHGQLDLLVRFPISKKPLFGIAFRSQADASIIYKEQREALYIRTRKGGLKLWKPDHIERLARQETWLRQNQSELFGRSSRERSRPLVKILVLTKQTKLGKNAEHLYTQVGDQRVLLIRRKSSIYIMEEPQLIPFIQAWMFPPGQ